MHMCVLMPRWPHGGRSCVENMWWRAIAGDQETGNFPGARHRATVGMCKHIKYRKTCTFEHEPGCWSQMVFFCIVTFPTSTLLKVLRLLLYKHNVPKVPHFYQARNFHRLIMTQSNRMINIKLIISLLMVTRRLYNHSHYWYYKQNKCSCNFLWLFLSQFLYIYIFFSKYFGGQGWGRNHPTIVAFLTSGNGSEGSEQEEIHTH